MSDIVEAVAKAITQAIDESERVQLLTRDEMMAKAARAAIKAYEAAKGEDRHAIRIENGVVYFSDGTAENPSEAIAKANRDNGIGKLFAEGITGTTSVKDIIKGWKP